MGHYNSGKPSMNVSLRTSVPFLIAVISLLIIITLCLGPTLVNPFSLPQVFEDPFESRILTHLGLPIILRSLLAMPRWRWCSGIFRNPLADPYVLGISVGIRWRSGRYCILTADAFITTVVFGFVGAISVSAFVASH